MTVRHVQTEARMLCLFCKELEKVSMIKEDAKVSLSNFHDSKRQVSFLEPCTTIINRKILKHTKPTNLYFNLLSSVRHLKIALPKRMDSLQAKALSSVKLPRGLGEAFDTAPTSDVKLRLANHGIATHEIRSDCKKSTKLQSSVEQGQKEGYIWSWKQTDSTIGTVNDLLSG